MNQNASDCLSGGGECGRLLRAIDWLHHPLGPVETWPRALCHTVRLVLNSKFPMMIHWGPDLITFYNDAYALILGTKHPGHLGAPAKEWWPELWDKLQPIFDQVLAGEAYIAEDALYVPDRSQGQQEVYFTHCHSPIWGDDNKIEGIFLVATETTRGILAEKNLQDAKNHLEKQLADTLKAERKLAESAAYERAIIDSSTDFAIIATDIHAKIVRWNEGARRILGWSEAEMKGETADKIFTPEDRVTGIPEAEMQNALQVGHGTDERWHLRKDGSRFWGSGLMMPLRLADGVNIGYLKILHDRTRERLVEEGLREARERLEAALETGLIGFFEWDVPSESFRGDSRFASFYDIGIERMANGIPMQELDALIHPDDRLHVSETVAAALRNKSNYVMEFRIIHPGLPTRWITVSADRYVKKNQPVRYTGVAIDITESKEAEDVRRVLTFELQHRVKNILSVVQSIAGQTLRGTSPEVAEALSARIGALASAQNILTQSSWQSAPIREVVDQTLQPHHGLERRFIVQGPALLLSAKKALSLSLALHELATNAAKYGALSNPKGLVHVEWQKAGDEFEFIWKESGGPPVSVPEKKGFGSRLIERALAMEFQGGVQMIFEPDGLKCVIRARASQLME